MAMVVAKPGPSITTGNPKSTCGARRGEETPSIGRTRGQIQCAGDKDGEGRLLSSVPAAGAVPGASDSVSGPFPATLTYQHHQKSGFFFPVSPTKSISGADTPRQGPCQAGGKAVTFPVSVTVGSGLGSTPGRVILREAGSTRAEESGAQGAF